MASVLLVLPEQTKCNVIYSNLGSTCENNLIKRRKYMGGKNRVMRCLKMWVGYPMTSQWLGTQCMILTYLDQNYEVLYKRLIKYGNFWCITWRPWSNYWGGGGGGGSLWRASVFKVISENTWHPHLLPSVWKSNWLPVLTTSFCRHRDLNTRPSACNPPTMECINCNLMQVNKYIQY